MVRVLSSSLHPSYTLFPFLPSPTPKRRFGKINSDLINVSERSYRLPFKSSGAKSSLWLRSPGEGRLTTVRKTARRVKRKDFPTEARRSTFSQHLGQYLSLSFLFYLSSFPALFFGTIFCLEESGSCHESRLLFLRRRWEKWFMVWVSRKRVRSNII